jgi:ElaB/YqjD/DUF883 family membrane-anchored ribosome-binding protein
MDTSSSKRSADSGIDRISQSAHQAVDKAAAYAERISEKGDALKQVPQDWMEGALDYVRENPLQALGIAVAAGYLLHMITRR